MCTVKLKTQKDCFPFIIISILFSPKWYTYSWNIESPRSLNQFKMLHMYVSTILYNWWTKKIQTAHGNKNKLRTNLSMRLKQPKNKNNEPRQNLLVLTTKKCVNKTKKRLIMRWGQLFFIKRAPLALKDYAATRITMSQTTTLYADIVIWNNLCYFKTDWNQ